MKTSFLFNKNLFLTLLFLLIANIVTIRYFDAPLKNQICESGITSFELAKDLDISIEILNSWDASAKIAMALSLGFDFLFLLVYSSFIALLIYRVNFKLWKEHSFYLVGKLLIYAIFLAAFFDVIENIALIKLMLGDLSQIWSSISYYFAVVKFGIVLICIIYLLLSWIGLLVRKLR